MHCTTATEWLATRWQLTNILYHIITHIREKKIPNKFAYDKKIRLRVGKNVLKKMKTAGTRTSDNLIYDSVVKFCFLMARQPWWA